MQRQGDEVKALQFDAEYAAFFKASELSSENERTLRNHSQVKGVRHEGDWVRTTWRDNQFLRRAVRPGGMFEAMGVTPYEGDVNPVRRWLTDTNVELQKPRRCYVDLETDSRRTFQDASEGRTRILCWSLTDDQLNTKYGVLDEDTPAAERLVLEDLWLELFNYDQVIAWSGQAWADGAARETDVFDFKIIARRSEGLSIAIDPRRWLWLSHMMLFRRLNMSASESGDEKQSLGINAVAAAMYQQLLEQGLDTSKLTELELRFVELLKGGKEEFDSSKTWEAWEADGQQREDLIDYNIRDAELMPAIEWATGYIDLHFEVCKVSSTLPDTRGMNPTQFVEGFLMKLGAKHGMRAPCRQPVHRDPFEGAYVMEPRKKGLLHDVHVFDFSGLYPSCIVTWNMSPDTWLGSAMPSQLRPSTLTTHARVPRDKQEDEVVDLRPVPNLPEGTCVVPITRQMFDITRPGLLAMACREMMRLRQVYKDEMKRLPPKSREWQEAWRLSMAYKICVNSFYGVVGSPTFRYFKREVAESVAQAGKWLLLNTLFEGQKHRIEAVAGDTDSGFVDGAEDEVVRKFVAWCNAELYPKLLVEYGCPENLISLAYQEKFSTLVYVRKKRYAGRFSVYDGKPVQGVKFEIKGLEYKRGDTTRLARKMQFELIQLMLEDLCTDVEVFEQFVERWKKHVLEDDLQLEDIVQAKKLSKPISAYVTKTKKNGEPQLPPPHAQIAKLLVERGRRVREGVRIEYVVTDAAVSPQKVIPLEDFDGKFDRFYLWENLIFPASMRVLEPCFPDVKWKQHLKARPRRPRGKRFVDERNQLKLFGDEKALSQRNATKSPSPPTEPPVKKRVRIARATEA